MGIQNPIRGDTL